MPSSQKSLDSVIPFTTIAKNKLPNTPKGAPSQHKGLIPKILILHNPFLILKNKLPIRHNGSIIRPST